MSSASFKESKSKIFLVIQFVCKHIFRNYKVYYLINVGSA
ncbi:hypothetical protein LEP1GSC172_0139 [Leptospira noguchii]|uniref:Uncharacterized protein n=1 Tax=Leptospira noguchii TaxID=28182 RepID=M6VAX3_9LEPT|nr:hypothetical protein LEP1GSC172_0139 [Leptospira noguchii]